MSTTVVANPKCAAILSPKLMTKTTRIHQYKDFYSYLRRNIITQLIQ